MSGETAQDGNVGDDESYVPQSTIDCSTTISANNCSVTGTPSQVPDTPNAVLKPIDMGLPPTPTARVPVMPSEDAMDNGYDSDGQLGSFLQDGVSEQTDFCMDEATIRGEKALNVEGTEIAETTENVDESVVPEVVDALK